MSGTTDLAAAECGIRQLQARYIDAVWRQDFDAFGDCFVEDCEWRAFGLVLRGRAEIVDYNQQLFSKFHRILINLRTPIIDVGIGTATGRTYFSAQNVLADGRSYAPIGRYFEHFVDGGDRWRFKWRLFQTLYSGPPDFSGTFYDNIEFGPPPAMPPLDEAADNNTGLNIAENVGPMG